MAEKKRFDRHPPGGGGHQKSEVDGRRKLRLENNPEQIGEDQKIGDRHRQAWPNKEPEERDRSGNGGEGPDVSPGRQEADDDAGRQGLMPGVRKKGPEKKADRPSRQHGGHDQDNLHSRLRAKKLADRTAVGENGSLRLFPGLFFSGPTLPDLETIPRRGARHEADEGRPEEVVYEKKFHNSKDHPIKTEPIEKPDLQRQALHLFRPLPPDLAKGPPEPFCVRIERHRHAGEGGEKTNDDQSNGPGLREDMVSNPQKRDEDRRP